MLAISFCQFTATRKITKLALSFCQFIPNKDHIVKAKPVIRDGLIIQFMHTVKIKFLLFNIFPTSSQRTLHRTGYIITHIPMRIGSDTKLISATSTTFLILFTQYPMITARNMSTNMHTYKNLSKNESCWEILVFGDNYQITRVSANMRS